MTSEKSINNLEPNVFRIQPKDGAVLMQLGRKDDSDNILMLFELTLSVTQAIKMVRDVISVCEEIVKPDEE